MAKSPAQVSKLGQGQGSVNLHGAPPADPSDVWGLLKDRQGSEALQGFREKLPERYRRLLEDYYRELSPEKQAPPAPAAPGGRNP